MPFAFFKRAALAAAKTTGAEARLTVRTAIGMPEGMHRYKPLHLVPPIR